MDKNISLLNLKVKELFKIAFKIKEISEKDLIILLDEIINEFNNFFDTGNENDINDMIESLHDKKRNVPLYLRLDLIIIAIDHFYKDEITDKPKINKLLSELINVREKVALNSSYDFFEPNENIDDNVLKIILNTDSNFYLEVNFLNNERYLSISGIYEKEDLKYYKEPFYKRDKEKFNESMYEKKTNANLKLLEISQKYFKEEIIPYSLNDFDEALIDENINSKLKSILIEITKYVIEERKKYVFISDSYIEISMSLLHAINEFEKKELEIKNFNSKGFIWKLLNRKKNPNNYNDEDYGQTNIKI